MDSKTKSAPSKRILLWVAIGFVVLCFYRSTVPHTAQSDKPYYREKQKIYDMVGQGDLNSDDARQAVHALNEAEANGVRP